MNKSDLVEKMAKDCDISKAVAEKALNPTTQFELWGSCASTFFPVRQICTMVSSLDPPNKPKSHFNIERPHWQYRPQ